MSKPRERAAQVLTRLGMPNFANDVRNPPPPPEPEPERLAQKR